MKISSHITSGDQADHCIQFSILTIHYKSSKYRTGLLESLREYTKNYEYLEHSNDAQNLGYARATNNLIRESKGKYIILLNPDCQVTKHWVDELRKTADSDPKIGIVVPKLLRLDNIIDSTGHDYSKWPRAIGNRGEGEPDHGQYDNATELVSSSFGCALIKRELFNQIGLLDERFFLYYEDVEYSHRARQGGWRVVYCPTSIVHHERHGSGHNKWMAESRRYLPFILRKYYPKHVLASWYLWKVKATIAGLRNRDLVYASSNFKAIVDGVW